MLSFRAERSISPSRYIGGYSPARPLSHRMRAPARGGATYGSVIWKLTVTVAPLLTVTVAL